MGAESTDGLNFDPDKVLFVGLSKSAVMFYRCMLPALSMGADYVGMTSQIETGFVKGAYREPDLDDYEIIVLQQPYSEEGCDQIRDMQKHGQKVIYEIDDYSHGVIDPKADHHLAKKWSKKRLYWTEKSMEAADLVICSTQRLADRYSEFNKTVVCKNGIDAGRYMLDRPERENLHYGWAGGHGHTKAIKPALKAIAELMNKYKNTGLVTVGHTEYGEAFHKQIPGRVLVIPFTFMEIYPGACMNIDIGIAPAHEDSFFECKSDLRFLEYAMMGIPAVYHPLIYLEVEDEKTGLIASDYESYKEQLERLTVDEDLRNKISNNAKEYVLKNRTFPNAAQSWVDAFNEVVL